MKTNKVLFGLCSDSLLMLIFFVLIWCESRLVQWHHNFAIILVWFILPWRGKGWCYVFGGCGVAVIVMSKLLDVIKTKARHALDKVNLDVLHMCYRTTTFYAWNYCVSHSQIPHSIDILKLGNIYLFSRLKQNPTGMRAVILENGRFSRNFPSFPWKSSTKQKCEWDWFRLVLPEKVTKSGIVFQRFYDRGKWNFLEITFHFSPGCSFPFCNWTWASRPVKLRRLQFLISILDRLDFHSTTNNMVSRS